MSRQVISVIGGGKTEKALLKEAEEAGRLIAIGGEYGTLSGITYAL